MKKEKSYFLKNIWKLLECSKREEKRNKKNEKNEDIDDNDEEREKSYFLENCSII